MRSFRSAVIAVCVLSSLVTGCAGEADSGEGSVPQSGPQVTTEDAPWSEAPTQKGTYLVAWKPAGGTVPLNEYCSILMRVNRADGSPIEGQVELFFRADMPAHGHGMNVVPVVKPVADGLYQALLGAGYEVLIDDRDERPGVMFADLELLGIPHRAVIGERSLDRGMAEYRHRSSGEERELGLDSLATELSDIIDS